MSKLNKKLSILFASFAMAMGVGLVGTKNAKEVKADNVKFVLVEEALEDWSGKYIITGHGSTTALSPKDLVSTNNISDRNTFTVSISNKTISEDESNAFVFSKSGSGYSIAGTGTDGSSTWYIGHSGGSNTLNPSSTAYVHTSITIDSTYGVQMTGSDDYSLRFNSSNNPQLFRYYKSAATATIPFVDLYKMVESTTDPEKTVTEVTGVGEHPSEIFVGETIDGSDVELNVLYDDGESGVETAHHVDVDSSVAANGVTATAYYDEDETMSATFTVDVLELPDTVALFESSKIVTTQNYREYSDNDWILTFGGNNNSGGTNQNNANNCKVDSKYIGDAGVSSSVLSFAIVSVNKLNNVGKLEFKYTGGSGYNSAKMYLTSSTDGSTYSMVTLTTGDQGMSVGSTNTEYVFEFEKIESAYYAIVIASTITSAQNFRLDYITAEFFAAPEKVNLVEQFIADWHAMRAEGSNGICDFDLNGENALTDLLKRFEDFGEEDKELIRSSIDVDDVTIGQTMDYINNVLKSEAVDPEMANLSSFIMSASDNTTSLVALFAILGLVAVSAYYFIEKRKLAK